jgi:hypothetical protein
MRLSVFKPQYYKGKKTKEKVMGWGNVSQYVLTLKDKHM